MSRSNAKAHVRYDRYMIATLAGLPALVLVVAHVFRGAEADVFAAVFSLILLVVAAVTAAVFHRRTLPPEVFLIGTMLAAAGLLGWIGNWYQARHEYITLWAAVAIFGAGSLLGSSRITLNYARTALIVSGGVYAAVFLSVAVLTKVSEPGLFWSDSRLTATFISPNILAGLFIILLILSLGRMLTIAEDMRRRDMQKLYVIGQVVRKRFLAVLTFTCVLAGLLMTSSRAGIAIGFGVSLLYGVQAFWPARAGSGQGQGLKIFLPAAVGGLILLVMLNSLGSGLVLGDRVGDVVGDAQGRIVLFEHYWQLWQEKWLFGHGLGGFNRANDAIVTIENAPVLVQTGAAHNVVLQWLIQGGVVGLGAVIIAWAAMHYTLVRQVLAGTRLDTPFGYCVLLLSGAVFLHGMVDYALEIPSIMWTYVFILGLANGNARARLSSAKSGQVEVES